jgi:hypothetical protein
MGHLVQQVLAEKSWWIANIPLMVESPSSHSINTLASRDLFNLSVLVTVVERIHFWGQRLWWRNSSDPRLLLSGSASLTGNQHLSILSCLRSASRMILLLHGYSVFSWHALQLSSSLRPDLTTLFNASCRLILIQNLLWREHQLSGLYRVCTKLPVPCLTMQVIGMGSVLLTTPNLYLVLLMLL